MHNDDKVLLYGFLAFLAFCFLGWAQNLWKLAQCDFQAPYTAEVMHGVGLIPPVGAIVGWMDFGR
jgi:hypothetical protein